MRQIILVIALILVVAAPLLADGPMLKVNDADPAARGAVSLEVVRVEAVVDGPLARTSMTLTFRNNLGRVLEGELEFPLPQGATVSGYALDVPIGSGNLVDGVPIEKERARQIFETEVRRGIDPGIVEQTRGNNFRTRIYPLMANGTRTVRITYVSDVTSTKDGSTFAIPLDFKTALKSANIRVELLNTPPAVKPRIDGLANVAFVPNAGGLVAEQQFADVTLGGQLTVHLPPLPTTLTRVETRLQTPSLENPNPDSAKAETYFLISTVPVVQNARAVAASPTRVCILWDTSLSRLEADKAAEFAFIEAFAAKRQNFVVDVVTTTDFSKTTFNVNRGNADALLAHLKGLSYDGALRIDKITVGQHASGLYLFFSDGLVALGQERFTATSVPIYTICSDSKANHSLLNQMAVESGGLYYNLQRIKPVDAAAGILSPRQVLTIAANENEVAELYPKGAITITEGSNERINITGRLLGRSATVTLTVNGRSERVTLVRDEKSGKGSGLVPTFWANQKIDYLAARVETNAEALLAVGKQFGLVTPNTSLIVLETLHQYVQYRVVPPKSSPELYKQFIDRIENDKREKQREETEKIVRVLALWQTRVQWWEKKFEVPKNFVYKGQSGKATGGSSGGSLFGDGGSSSGSLFSDGDPQVRMQNNVRRPNMPPPAPPTPVAPAAAPVTVAPPSLNLSDVEKNKSVGVAVTIKPWTPDTPYLKALAAAPSGRAYQTYLEVRKDYLQSPAFYLDCANFFIEKKQHDIGIRILTNIAALRLESAPLLRIAAYRLMQLGQYELAIDLFEKAKKLRPDEPQSWRDLAIAISEQAMNRIWQETRPDVRMHQWRVDQVRRALELYKHVVMNRWERFNDIEVIALMEANALWAAIQQSPSYKIRPITNPLDPRLVKNLDCDIRIVLTWDADSTDVDLHVQEPTGEKAYYSHPLTTIGGLVSKDFTQGYGPEEYCLRVARGGTYTVRAHYYGSSQQTVTGPVTLHATVFTNFGRPNQSQQSLTLRLSKAKDMETLGEIKFQVPWQLKLQNRAAIVRLQF
ncbi:MAG: DUF2135 domain-containing protein [Phycisphaerales bacterium]|nr:DUF2135 domain-containing protein [Phycisphaerales bacterium]